MLKPVSVLFVAAGVGAVLVLTQKSRAATQLQSDVDASIKKTLEQLKAKQSGGSK